MQRPSCALAALFTTFAGLLLASSVSAAPPIPRVGNIPVPTVVNHHVETQMYTSLQGTGYDSAYDFAMFDGFYLQVCAGVWDEPSEQVEEMTECGNVAERGVAMRLHSGPANTIYFDDRHCFAEDAECYGGITSSNDSDADGSDAGDGSTPGTGAGEESEAEGQVGASALDQEWGCEIPCETPVTVTTWATVKKSLRRIGETSRKAWQGSWMPVVWDQTPLKSVADSGQELITSTWEQITIRTRAEQTYSEEIVMLRVANSLDFVGRRLQDAAQQLRFAAADRIVSKGQTRRVANR